MAPIEALERPRKLGPLGGQIRLPVPELPHELGVVPLPPDDEAGDGEENRRFRPWVRRDPVIGMRRGVGQTHVHHDQLRALLLPVHDPLGVRIEVVAGLEVSADEQDHLGVGVIGTGPIETHPELIPRPRRRRADVGVRVVAVHTPGREHALGVAILARPADVVHDVVRPLVDYGLADPSRDVVHRLVPRHPLEPARAPLPHPLQRIQDAIDVVNLIEGRRTLGAVAPARPGMLGVPLELPNLERLLVDVGKQTARRFAVEAGGGNQNLPQLLPARPRLRIQLDPVVPPSPWAGTKPARPRSGPGRRSPSGPRYRS